LLHLVVVPYLPTYIDDAWSNTNRVCFRKGGFSKTNAETPASKGSDLSSEIFDQAPDGISKEEFEHWLDIDNNAEVVATIQ
jgi:hypothetical protein